MDIKSGELVVLTRGEYSEYRIVDIGKANFDLNVDELLLEYLNLYPQQKEKYRLDQNKFLFWLLEDKNILTDLCYKEFCVGDSLENIEIL